ncbi:glycosyl transferase, group 1 [Arcticibacter svalbardensis MN12-7]|uniref:Glycosyl transferase, group 1 n=1 Tax=Arcticibacter svalbardensis MN12-7 TaxID=1150600 RepID=R9GRT9_9SPHI|nr:glycosyltransferase [Arcticibacter svalbardensis]EOR94250.1 glycosyl transferase, group 1 [Arcticibacter svalbardensis MN12-7]
MKLAYFYRNLNQGGIQKMIVNAANYFVEQGNDVSVVLMIPGGEYVSLLDPRIKLIYFRSLKKSRLFFSFSDILKREKFDVLFTATPSLNTFTVIGRLMARVKTKIVISERNNTVVFFKNSALTLSKLTFLSIPLLYRFADAIVAVSKGLGQSLQKVALIPANKIHVIYNPAWSPELEKQAGLPVQHEWLNDDTVPVLITVGRLVDAKNHALLIDAIALLSKKREVRLIIIGEGPLREKLQSQINSLNLQDCISLEGFKLNPVSWMSKANLFVLSSDYEGFGNVLVEALAAGLTIVSTDCDYGPAEILEDRYGFLVPIGQVNALSEQINYALDHPIDRDLLISRAREFSVNQIMQHYQSLFSTLIS